MPSCGGLKATYAVRGSPVAGSAAIEIPDASMESTVVVVNGPSGPAEMAQVSTLPLLWSPRGRAQATIGRSAKSTATAALADGTDAVSINCSVHVPAVRRASLIWTGAPGEGLRPHAATGSPVAGLRASEIEAIGPTSSVCACQPPPWRTAHSS